MITKQNYSRVDAGMVGRGQLPDVRDKIDHMRVMRSRDPVEFGTRLDEDWVKLYLFFGAIHPHLVGTAAVHIIAVSYLFYITTFI